MAGSAGSPLWAAEDDRLARRNGFPDASKHTVDRLMRDEGMAGLIRGTPDPHHHPGKDGSGRRTC